jgi:tetratricopeptide (TPR) repeat protein
MGLLGKLFGKKPRDDASSPAPSTHDAAEPGEPGEPGEPDIAPELASALAAFQAGRYKKAIEGAVPHVERLADAARLCALAYSEMERYAEAFPYWLKLFEQEPSAHNALQLATTSVMCGEVERGEAWLTKAAQVNHDTHEQSDATARVNFISALMQSGHLREALPHLAWMRDVYAHMRITDSTFLYMRGIPFFSSFLEKSLEILKATQPVDAIVSWYGELDGKLDEEGAAQLAEWIGQLKGQPAV